MFQTPSYILHRITDAIRPSWGDTPQPAPSTPPHGVTTSIVPVGDPAGRCDLLKTAPAVIASFFVSTGMSNPAARSVSITMALQSVLDTLQNAGYPTTQAGQGPYWMVRVPSGRAILHVLDLISAKLGKEDIRGHEGIDYTALLNDPRELVLPITGYAMGAQYYEQKEPLDLARADSYAFLAVGYPLIAGKELTVFGFRPPVYLNPWDYGMETMVAFHLEVVERVLNGFSSAGTHISPYADSMYALAELKPVDTVQFRRTPQFGVSLYRKGADPEKHLPLTTLNTGQWYTGVLMPALFWTDAAQQGLQGVLNRTAAEVKQAHTFLMGLPPGHGY